MAPPDRRDPRYNDVNRPIEGETTSGWFAWWWIWLIIIICIIWFAGWGWGGYGGWWWGARGRTVAVAPVNNYNYSAVTGSGVAILNATDKVAFIGHPFTVYDVPVQNKHGNQVLWIGSNNTAPMLVVLTGANNTTNNANIGQGQRVDVVGTVQKAPPVNQAKQNWNLGNDGAQRLEQQGAYIQASQVQNATGQNHVGLNQNGQTTQAQR